MISNVVGPYPPHLDLCQLTDTALANYAHALSLTCHAHSTTSLSPLAPLVATLNRDTIH